MNIGIIPYSKDLGHVMNRWRYDVLIKHLPNCGHSAEYFEEGKNYDVIIVSLCDDNYEKFLLARKTGAAIIGDVTDNLLEFPFSNYTTAGLAYYRLTYLCNGQFRHIADMLSKSRFVVCGSQAQEKAFAEHNKNRAVITDAVTDDILSFAARYDNPAPCRLIWFGNVVSLHGFEDMGNALDILAERGNYELVLITSNYVQGRHLGTWPRTVLEFISVQKIPCRQVLWRYDNLLTAAATCDIGIVPVKMSDPFMAAKPSGRALLMMGMGLPVVTSALDSYTRDIGNAGFIAHSPEEWVETVESLRADADLRKRIGTAAREKVINEFSEKPFTQKYLTVLNALGAVK